MDRTIKVTGKGKISAKPDQIRLLLDLSDLKKTYEETLRTSAETAEALKDIFEGLGFDRTDLKTTYFDINTKYEDYQARDRSWKQRFEGYEFTHKMKIEFDADNDVLGKVLYALGHAAVKPEIRIAYTVKDPEAAKNQLLAKAIEDSKEKAQVLTEAAGVSLDKIITIDYSWGEIEISSMPMKRMLAEADECLPTSYNIDIEPENIEVTDTVTVVWSIV